MGRRPTVAVLGGTFDRIHVGHLALLDVAFARSDSIGIGLTTARYLADHPKPYARRVRPYPLRRRALDRLLRKRYPGRAYTIVPLDDPFGGSLRPGVDLLVVSDETLSRAGEVNRRRRQRHLPALRIVVVPRVRGEDGRPVAGRRIRQGSIDEQGRRRTPLVVRVTSNDTVLRSIARRALQRAYAPLPVRWAAGASPRELGAHPSRTLALRLASKSKGRADVTLVVVGLADGRAFAAVSTPEGGPTRAGGFVRLQGPGGVQTLARWIHPPKTVRRPVRESPDPARARKPKHG
ncbi:MAG: pantetheine-phosphate adenylyltransferase [Thermoplasmata archaeon]|nr:pantetheine-phosphate adenylyltransferase [Thermoplasmata archaeon]MCI4358932.1 pantetheine-phosphate adenylyltransferase [Thermoplasmata archaeon]